MPQRFTADNGAVAATTTTSVISVHVTGTIQGICRADTKFYVGTITALAISTMIENAQKTSWVAASLALAVALGGCQTVGPDGTNGAESESSLATTNGLSMINGLSGNGLSGNGLLMTALKRISA